MESKIRVHGKAQNRTALGIVNAYLTINPNATLEELRKVFPNSINPDSGTKEIFMTESAIKQKIAEGDEWFSSGNGYFIAADEYLQLQDGTRFAVVRMWTKNSLDRIVKVAEENGIEIASFEKGKAFNKGGFSLEYLNGWTPSSVTKIVPEKANKTVVKTHIPRWVWLVLILAIAIVVFLLLRPKTEPKVITVVDTVYVQQIEEIEQDFNAAQFDKDNADLNDNAKFVLHDLANLMERKADLQLRIVGHTSEEGDPIHNQKLSEARARAAVDFLISQGIDESRLEFEGKGSAEPLEPGNHEKNRRTEFEIL